MNFNYLSRRGGNKRGGNMVQGQVFLKKKGGGWGRGRRALLRFNFVKVYDFYI